MKFALFIIAICLIILHGIAVVSAYDKGYVYAVAEYINQDYTGYMKLGHSSDAPGLDRYLNIRRRLSNIQAGNPRRLARLLMCQCNSKDIGSYVERTVRDTARTGDRFANQLGGSNEWLRMPRELVARVLGLMASTARDRGCTCPFNLPQKN